MFPITGDIGIFVTIGNPNTRETFSRNIDRMELYLHNLIVVKSFVAGKIGNMKVGWPAGLNPRPSGPPPHPRRPAGRGMRREWPGGSTEYRGANAGPR